MSIRMLNVSCKFLTGAGVVLSFSYYWKALRDFREDLKSSPSSSSLSVSSLVEAPSISLSKSPASAFLMRNCPVTSSTRVISPSQTL